MIRECRPATLTVDDHVDVFDVGCGHIVAGLALVASGLVSHDPRYVQVLLSIQRLSCPVDTPRNTGRNTRNTGRNTKDVG